MDFILVGLCFSYVLVVFFFSVHISRVRLPLEIIFVPRGEWSCLICDCDVFTCFDLDINRWWCLSLLGAPIPRQNREIGAITLAYGPPHEALGCLASFSACPTGSSVIIVFLF